MKHHKMKSIKIADELIGFCLNLGAHNVDIHIKTSDKEIEVEVAALISSLSSDRIDNVRNQLNCEKQTEVGSYYWELTGENIEYSELSLLGMMIDEAFVEYSNDILKMKVIMRK
jgi:hypothetical protein